MPVKAGKLHAKFMKKKKNETANVPTCVHFIQEIFRKYSIAKLATMIYECVLHAGKEGEMRQSNRTAVKSPHGNRRTLCCV